MLWKSNDSQISRRASDFTGTTVLLTSHMTQHTITGSLQFPCCSGENLKGKYHCTVDLLFNNQF